VEDEQDLSQNDNQNRVNNPQPTKLVMTTASYYELCRQWTLQKINSADIKLCRYRSLHILNSADTTLCGYWTLLICNSPDNELSRYWTMNVLNWYWTLQILNFVDIWVNLVIHYISVIYNVMNMLYIYNVMNMLYNMWGGGKVSTFILCGFLIVDTALHMQRTRVASAFHSDQFLSLVNSRKAYTHTV
jgi:hypothetical protein